MAARRVETLRLIADRAEGFARHLGLASALPDEEQRRLGAILQRGAKRIRIADRLPVHLGDDVTSAEARIGGAPAGLNIGNHDARRRLNPEFLRSLSGERLDTHAEAT